MWSPTSHSACPRFKQGLTHVENCGNDLFLVNFSEAGGAFDLPIFNKYIQEIHETTKYLYQNISQKHPDLGREGAVCPFTPAALRLKQLYFSIYPKDLSDREAAKELFLKYLDLFLETNPKEGRGKVFKSFVIILPEVNVADTKERVEGIHAELKPYFTKKGLMLGEFHQTSDSPGMHSPDFRPLRSPIPLLVIRYMMPTDYHFLEDYSDDYFNNFRKNYDPKAISFFEEKKRAKK